MDKIRVKIFMFFFDIVISVLKASLYNHKLYTDRDCLDVISDGKFPFSPMINPAKLSTGAKRGVFG